MSFMLTVAYSHTLVASRRRKEFSELIMTLENGTLQRKHIVLIALCYLVFILFALYGSGFGANVPVMMAHYNISFARQGFIITMQSLGGLIASTFIALFGERYNKFNAIFVGVLLFGIGAAAIGLAPPYTILIFLFMLCGAGAITADSVINAMIPELFPKHKKTLISWLHAFFSLGSMGAPIFVTMLVNPAVPLSFTGPYLFTGAMLICTAIFFLISTRSMIAGSPYANMASAKKRVAENPAEIFKTKKAWLFFIASFLYFSFSSCIASWLPSYCMEIGIDFSTAGLMLTMYFIGSVTMRFCGPLVLKFFTMRFAYILFSLISTILLITALFVENQAVMMVLIAGGGFMQGSCVSILVLMCMEAFPKRMASASSLTLIAACLAALIMPFAMGTLAELTGFRTPLILICSFLALSALPIFIVSKPNFQIRQ